MLDKLDARLLAALTEERQTKSGTEILLDASRVPSELHSAIEDAQFFYPFTFETDQIAAKLNDEYVRAAWELVQREDAALRELRHQADVGDPTESHAFMQWEGMIADAATRAGLRKPPPPLDPEVVKSVLVELTSNAEGQHHTWPDVVAAILSREFSARVVVPRSMSVSALPTCTRIRLVAFGEPSLDERVLCTLGDIASAAIAWADARALSPADLTPEQVHVALLASLTGAPNGRN